METSQHLASESFSHSWLSNVLPSFDDLDEPIRMSIDGPHEASGLKLDHETKKNICLTNAQIFKFDVSGRQSPLAHVHADELFCNGLIKPVYIDPLKAETSNSLSSIPTMPSPPFSSKTVSPTVRTRCFSKRGRKLSNGILRKCLKYIRFFFDRGGSRKVIRVDDIDRRECRMKCQSSSLQESPRASAACSTRQLCYLENPIEDAILHCKRSVGK